MSRLPRAGSRGRATLRAAVRPMRLSRSAAAMLLSLLLTVTACEEKQQSPTPPNAAERAAAARRPASVSGEALEADKPSKQDSRTAIGGDADDAE